MCEHVVHTVQEIRDEFSEKCREQLEKSYTKRGFHFLCCVDGSDNAHLAYDVCMALRRKYDYVSIFHAYRDCQEEVPEKYRADTIRTKYAHELALHMSPTYSSLHWEGRHDRSVIDTLQDYIHSCDGASNHPDFIVLGHAGRKGKGYFAPLTSNCDWVLRTIRIPCIIARPISPPRRDGRTWLMAVDGTIYSNRGLDIILQLMGARDRLDLFYIFTTTEDADHLQQMKLLYEGELDRSAPHGCSFTLVELELGKDIKHGIVEYVNAANADFFAIGPRARATQSLSMVTSYVINNVTCSIVVCKN